LIAGWIVSTSDVVARRQCEQLLPSRNF